MSDEQAQEQQRRRGIPAGLDPRNFDPRALDPRRAIDPAHFERMMHAQNLARAQAAATSTVMIATMVSLITSAFGFVAALAWNTAVQQLITENIKTGSSHKIFGVTLSPGGVDAVYAALVTLVAVIVIVIINRFARGIAKNSVIGAGNN